MLQDTDVMGLTLSMTTLQTLMYACQRMDNDKLLRDYHVPPVSSSTGSCTLHYAVQLTACTGVDCRIYQLHLHCIMSLNSCLCQECLVCRTGSQLRQT